MKRDEIEDIVELVVMMMVGRDANHLPIRCKDRNNNWMSS
jgi:hypothetical protein